MKVETIIKEVAYTCDYCGESSDDIEFWYKFSSIEKPGIRLWEKQSSGGHREVKHYTDRVNKDFCCLGCVKKYVTDSTDMFLAELAPIKNKQHKERFTL